MHRSPRSSGGNITEPCNRSIVSRRQTDSRETENLTRRWECSPTWNRSFGAQADLREFTHIGHSLFAFLSGLVGGIIAGRFYAKRERQWSRHRVNAQPGRCVTGSWHPSRDVSVRRDRRKRLGGRRCVPLQCGSFLVASRGQALFFASGTANRRDTGVRVTLAADQPGVFNPVLQPAFTMEAARSPKFP